LSGGAGGRRVRGLFLKPLPAKSVHLQTAICGEREKGIRNKLMLRLQSRQRGGRMSPPPPYRGGKKGEKERIQEEKKASTTRREKNHQSSV